MLKLLIDTDPGVDDALALLLALGSPKAEVLGVTTTFGNIDTNVATRNALYLLEFAGRPDIPVAQGAIRPLRGSPRNHATHVHGENGLGNVPLMPPHNRPIPGTAAEFIARTVMEHPGELTLVTLGPLTNLALALDLEPRLSQHVAQVVVMGGAYRVPGNVSETSEANLFNDPFAAARVFAQDWPLTLVGLDVTTRVVMTQPYLQGFQEPPSRVGSFIWSITRFYEDFHQWRHDLPGIYAHDPSAIACALEPGLFQYEEVRVAVTLEGWEAGRTVLQPLSLAPPRKHSLKLCTGVDTPRLLGFIQHNMVRG